MKEQVNWSGPLLAAVADLKKVRDDATMVAQTWGDHETLKDMLTNWTAMGFDPGKKLLATEHPDYASKIISCKQWIEYMLDEVMPRFATILTYVQSLPESIWAYNIEMFAKYLIGRMRRVYISTRIVALEFDYTYNDIRYRLRSNPDLLVHLVTACGVVKDTTKPHVLYDVLRTSSLERGDIKNPDKVFGLAMDRLAVNLATAPSFYEPGCRHELLDLMLDELYLLDKK